MPKPLVLAALALALALPGAGAQAAPRHALHAARHGHHHGPAHLRIATYTPSARKPTPHRVHAAARLRTPHHITRTAYHPAGNHNLHVGS